jgi:hypothetical protein
MSNSFITQVTIDCLINRKHLRNNKSNEINKEESKFYRKRAYNLFKELINNSPPEYLSPDVKYAYDKFINNSIQYFKSIDNNDIIQAEYTDLDLLQPKPKDCSGNFSNSSEADALLIRSIKTSIPTLDKYVTKTRTKKEVEIIIPKQKEIILTSPELKNKGVKKNNITSIYEDSPKKK